MKTWWSRQHQACREACIISIITFIALCTLFFRNWSEENQVHLGTLFQSTNSYRVNGQNGNYSLLYQYTVPLIGDDSFSPIGRLKLSEAELLRKSLIETSLIRHLGRAQLDQEQQQTYGFNKSIKIDAPGQDTWLIASGIDRLGYAMDTKGNLYQLDRDLAGQLNRSPQALRENTIGIPQHVTRIQQHNDWTIGYFRDRWWLDQGETSQLADQEICTDWVNVFKNTKAISFTQIADEKLGPATYFEGQNQYGKQVLALYNRGKAHGSDEFHIVERHQQINDYLLKEAFIINIDKNVFNYPAQAFVSKKLIPFDVHDAHLIQINNLVLAKVQNQWFVDKNIRSNSDQVKKLLMQLANIPNTAQKVDVHVGTIFTGSLQFTIPKTTHSVKVTQSIKRHQFIDKRLFPDITAQDITGLVIHNDADAPQFYQRQDDNLWDIDPETHSSVDNFITALSSARVYAWSHSFDKRQKWTSTLTIAIGEKRVIIKKTKDHLIGIESTGIQGYLDKDSIKDLFGE